MTERPAPVPLPDGSDPDPYPRYAALRAAGGVHLVQEPTGLCRWTVTGYEHGRQMLADPRLTKDPRAAWDELLAAGYVTGDAETDQYMFHLLNSDPPDHTRLRGMIQRSFSPGRAAALRPRIERTAAALLDGLDPGEPVDLIADYALPLAVRTMGEILGVPVDDFDEYRVWASAGLTRPGAAGAVMSRAEAYTHMRRFFAELIGRRVAELRDAVGAAPAGEPDVLTSLLLAREAGDPLTEQETIALLIFLLNTGQEPTVSMLANGVLALLNHPDQLELLTADLGLLPTAIDEFLRYDGSVALSTLRIAREPIELGDTVIPQGGIVSVIMNSADRDERRFTDPDRLDITRHPNPHLAYGHGIHRCLGVPLARMTGEIAFGELLRRFPRPRLACAPEELQWRPTRVMRGLAALPVLLRAD
ncbi:cytochrome P450 [Streptomyces sp. 1114.5]|uniref:cytochrome P450 family protein n=1 Tax=unclassified Streptomyces TaxID=2593676 RepID=UPI000BD26C4B|nr:MULTISPECIES: cytochrome P450 [unclassified Streptomyces]RKT17059.1 cytochrome P450 [Streptomyces sp. 1114.5]SOB83270.1 Cytochrome P450 [Streptomyces sp. 1331.2]